MPSNQARQHANRRQGNKRTKSTRLTQSTPVVARAAAAAEAEVGAALANLDEINLETEKHTFVSLIRSLGQRHSRANRGAPSRDSPWRNVARETAPPAARTGRHFFNTPTITILTSITHVISSLSPSLGEHREWKSPRQNLQCVRSHRPRLPGGHRRRYLGFPRVSGRSEEAFKDPPGGGKWHRNKDVGEEKYPSEAGAAHFLARVYTRRCHSSNIGSRFFLGQLHSSRLGEKTTRRRRRGLLGVGHANGRQGHLPGRGQSWKRRAERIPAIAQ